MIASRAGAAHRLLIAASCVIAAGVACAGSKPGAQTQPGEPRETAQAAPSAAAYPYLDFDPDTRPKGEPVARDAGTTADVSDAGPQASSAPKAYPPPPTCSKRVPTTAPLSLFGEEIIDSPHDPRLISLRKYIRRLEQRLHLECDVQRNDGRLFNLSCYDFRHTQFGGIRPEGVEGHLFEYNGRRFEPLPQEKLFPGAKKYADVVNSACESSDVAEMYQKVWLDREGMTFVAGISRNEEGGCRLEYAPHADWIGCGPLAYLAGYVQRAAAPNGALPEPLGWGEGHVVSRLASQQAVVKRINSRIDAELAKIPPGTTGSGCQVVLTTNQVVSLRCTREFNTAATFSYSVRTGAEIDRDTLFAVAGPRLVAAASKECTKRYLRKPKEEWENFVTSPIQLKASDLGSFVLTPSGVAFEVELEVQSLKGSKSTISDSCDAAYSATGLSLKKLGAIPAPTGSP